MLQVPTEESEDKIALPVASLMLGNYLANVKCFEFNFQFHVKCLEI